MQYNYGDVLIHDQTHLEIEKSRGNFHTITKSHDHEIARAIDTIQRLQNTNWDQILYGDKPSSVV